jgi:hypothetical protein
MYNAIIEKKLSNLVELQFPEFYRTDGPTFVAFLKEYYKWMEGISDKAVKINKGLINVSAKNNTVTLSDINSLDFNDYFLVGEKIAIYEEDGDYSLYTITAIPYSYQLTINPACDFTGKKLNFGTVDSKPNSIYHTRRFLEYDDIDKTADDFVVYFKEKYLKNIQFETKTNTRELVKHALDIYRSKGTERSADLLFRLVFGVGAKFYYPSEDILKLSDGVWYVPKYLELSLNQQSDKFVNKQIIGLTSGATAFAESLIRRTIKGKLIDVLYISAINGNFITGEIINTEDEIINNAECPRIIGSLTNVEVDVNGVGENFNVGDLVDIYSDFGEQGKGRITSVSDITGLVNFELLNTGYAYTTNAEVIISEKVLSLANVVTSSNTLYFDLFEKIYQPLANIEYVSSNGYFSNGESVTTYYANNSVKGTGTVLSTTSTNSTTGSLLIAIVSGNLNSNVYTSANAVKAQIGTFTDVSASANIMGVSKNMTLSLSNVVGTFIKDEKLYQITNTGIETSNAYVNNYVTTIGSNGTLKVSNTHNVIKTGELIYGETSNSSAYVNYTALNIGVKDIVNDFYAYEGNRTYGNTLLTTANVTTISTGVGASFSLANSLSYSEDIILNTDFIADYASIQINAASYGFPSMPSANLSTIIDTALNYDTLTIGRPNKLININKGADYNIAPFVLLLEPLTYQAKKRDLTEITLDSVPFYIGEIVTQSAVNSRGLVVDINLETNKIIVENFRFNSNNYFVNTSNSTTILVGDKSGFSANISNIIDLTENYMGVDASITTKTQTSNGAATGLKVIDSGFGFLPDVVVNFTKDNITIAQGFASIETNGKASGRYLQKGGFLSDQKKLYDGYYYQEFSYELRSSVALSKYEQILKQILHVAGTKYFGAFVKEIEMLTPITSNKALITVS